MLKKIVTADAPQTIGPYSQAVRAGSYLFISGQIPLDPKTGKLVGPSIEEQTKQVLLNLEAILKAEGLGFSQVVKTEIYLKDLGDFATVNEIYGKYFSHAIQPARQTMQVARLPLDSLIEISCIAFIQD